MTAFEAGGVTYEALCLALQKNGKKARTHAQENVDQTFFFVVYVV